MALDQGIEFALIDHRGTVGVLAGCRSDWLRRRRAASTHASEERIDLRLVHGLVGHGCGGFRQVEGCETSNANRVPNRSRTIRRRLGAACSEHRHPGIQTEVISMQRNED